MQQKFKFYGQNLISFVFLIGIYLLKLCFKLTNKKHINNQCERRILVLSYFNIGDIVCDSASLRALRKNWPDAYIHILVRREGGKEFLKNCPYIDKVDKITSQCESVKDYIRLLKKLCKLQFTHSVQLVRPFDQLRKSYIPFIIGIPNRYGLIDNKKTWLFKNCYTSSVKVGNRRSRKEESLEVVKLTGALIEDTHTECWLNLKYKSDISKKLSIQKNSEKILIIHPGSTMKFKCWPLDYFVEIIDELSSMYSLRIIITGVKEELNELDYIKTNCKTKVEVYTDLSLYEYIALLSLSALIITNDTAPLHFSIALKKSVISIFGPSIPDYAVGRDITDNCVILRSVTNCDMSDKCNIFQKMCSERKTLIQTLCGSKHQVCMESIPVRLVKYMANQILDQTISEKNVKVKPTNNFQCYNNFL